MEKFSGRSHEPPDASLGQDASDAIDLEIDGPAGMNPELEHFLAGLGPSLPSDYAPTTPAADPADDDVIVDVGGFSSTADDDAFVSDSFIRGAKHVGLTMPWETPLMAQIFGDQSSAHAVAMPLNWGTTELKDWQAQTDVTPAPQIPASCKWSCARYIKYTSDESYVVQRSKTMQTAVTKWRFILLLNYEQSDVGTQLAGPGNDEAILESVIGVKSPNTVLKRANSILMYYRWHASHGEKPFLPFDETDVWNYVYSLHDVEGSATRAQALVQALRFSHFVMGMNGALDCANSRRIAGQAQLQYSKKSPTKQARPLTVAEVKLLHRIAEDKSHSVVDRCIVSNVLMALYGRCRVSDLNHVHEILHDAAGSSGFVEITTRFHKGARSAQQKALLLPIVISGACVVDQGWVHVWINNRKEAGLPVSGLIDGAFMPCPAVADSVNWLKRPLTPAEVTNIIRSFLQSSDDNLTSHSIKATTLSWCAKAEMSRAIQVRSKTLTVTTAGT